MQIIIKDIIIFLYFFPLEPSAPQNLTLDIVNSTLVISWASPSILNGIVTYDVNITVEDLATDETTLFPGPITRNDSNRRIVAVVEPFSSYSVSIIAMTVGGTSEIIVDSIITNEGSE